MKKLCKLILAVFLSTALATAISALICTFSLKASEYNVAIDGIETPAKVVLISDLHSREYGKDNKRLLELIAEQKPDAVFAVGDMINGDADENEVRDMLRLLNELKSIAPVYFSPGNHEAEYAERTGEELLNRIEELDIPALNDSYVDTEIGGNAVRVGGTMGHGFPFGRSWEEFEASDEYVFLKKLEDTELPTICLAHMPDTIIFNYAYTYWNTDLFVSGHTHGGVIRIPGIGGLYAPMQGLLPQYDCGQFALGEHIQLIVSSGLSGYGWVPRIFNRPEICVINFIPD